MIMNLTKNILLLFLLNVIAFTSGAQQITDYLVNYQYNNSGLYRKNFRSDKSTDNKRVSSNHSSFVTDGKKLYYVLNSVGDAKYDSYEDVKWLKEPTYKDTLNSQLVFVSYDVAKRTIIAKPFGSNYINRALFIQMDEQRKSMCAILATYGDTVRLNPENYNEVVVFPNRMLRQWLVVFDLNGKLLSKCLLMHSPFSIASDFNLNLMTVSIGRFNFNSKIILSFYAKAKSTVLPNHFGDSLVSNKTYVLSYNQQSMKIDWLRIINSGWPYYFKHDIPSINFMIGFTLFNNPKRQDSIILLSDRFDKTIAQYSSKEENLAAGNVLSIFFQFDNQGNMNPVFSFKSIEHFGSADPILSSIVQNDNDILAVIYCTDTLSIYGKSFIGAINKSITPPAFDLPWRNLLLKLSFNNQSAFQLHNSKDSIAPVNVMKTKRGFYVLYPYDTKSKSYNLVSSDTVINQRQRDDLQNFTSFFTFFNKVALYDSTYKLKWLHNTSYINTIFDFENTTIIDYFPYPYHDLDFRLGAIFKFSEYPDCLMAGIYNCKPIAYFDTLQNGNSIKFLNTSEYNCNYKWDFGDGITSNQKSPTHLFKTNTAGYKISLVVTNTCGSDTFVRYFTSPSKISVFKNSLELKVYPNPVNGSVFFIENTTMNKLKEAKLYSLLGQILDCDIEEHSDLTYKIKIKGNVIPGIYYLKATTKSEITSIYKINIQ